MNVSDASSIVAGTSDVPQPPPADQPDATGGAHIQNDSCAPRQRLTNQSHAKVLIEA
ncbi:hypothetical protein ACS0X5_09080 [Burkholderia gladioli]|uniref:hypothetical protein n=1 Tax=Burkholderia gladioli TaxID=28095 RepID=UPI0012F749B6|nr:hypothetical protein [Burkholderia gladioli]CAG9237388.1 hypothetical protein BGLA2_780030 [Burkholderia gladioli]